MYALLLQDWVTVQAASTNPAIAITQTELAWLDTSPFLDLVTWLEVKEISSIPSANIYLAFQTAPTKDDALFAAMNDVTSSAAIPLAVGVQVGVYLRDTALCPLSHWLRWQIKPPNSTSWNATFRIWVAATQPGGFADDDLAFQAAEGGGGPAWLPGMPAISAGPNGPAPPNVLDRLARRVSTTATLEKNKPGSNAALAPQGPSRDHTHFKPKHHGGGLNGPLWVSTRLPSGAVAWNPHLAPGTTVQTKK